MVFPNAHDGQFGNESALQCEFAKARTKLARNKICFGLRMVRAERLKL
jgi:hypothetical protein